LKVAYLPRTLPLGITPSDSSILSCNFTGIDPQIEKWISTSVTVLANQTSVSITKAQAIVEIVRSISYKNNILKER
jgi:hypothetical protein